MTKNITSPSQRRRPASVDQRELLLQSRSDYLNLFLAKTGILQIT